MSIKCDLRFSDQGDLVYGFIAYDRTPFFKDKVFAKSIILEEHAKELFSKQTYKLLPSYVDLMAVEILNAAAFDAFINDVISAQLGNWKLEVSCNDSALFFNKFTSKKPKLKNFTPTELELAVSKEKFVNTANIYENIKWCANFLARESGLKLPIKDAQAADLLSETKLRMPLEASDGFKDADFLVASRFFMQGENWPKHNAGQTYPLIQLKRDLLQALSGIDCQGDIFQILNYKNNKHTPISRVLSATDALAPSNIANDMAKCNRKYEWMDGEINCANGYAINGISSIEIQIDSNIKISDFFKLKKYFPLEHEVRFASALQGLAKATHLNENEVSLEIVSGKFGISVSGENMSLMSEQENISYNIFINKDLSIKSSTTLLGYPY